MIFPLFLSHLQNMWILVLKCTVWPWANYVTFQSLGIFNPPPSHTCVHVHALSTNAHIFLGKTFQKDGKDKRTVFTYPTEVNAQGRTHMCAMRHMHRDCMMHACTHAVRRVGLRKWWICMLQLKNIQALVLPQGFSEHPDPTLILLRRIRILQKPKH